MYMMDLGMEPQMERIPESAIKEHFAGHSEFEIVPDRDNSDYVYLTRDLIQLEGRRYNAKRNHINKFNRLYKGQYVVIKRDLLDKTLMLQQKWCNIRTCQENPGLYEEDLAIRNALKNMDALDFRAGAIIIDGEIQAFSLGSKLNRDTAVIHVEKANPEFEGLYQIINQKFALFELANYKYINREQDLGDPGLRKAKLSYLPHHLLNKYVVRWKG
jgi:hypothetical protein